MAKRILLADDSVTAQNMGRKILTEAGYDVVTVNNGSAALKRIAEQAPELIILDVYMPGYTGLEVCQRIKAGPETSAIPVLLTVGKLEPFKADEAKRVHADAFIIKPFEATELLTVLAKLEDKITPLPSARTPQARTTVAARAPKTATVETAAAPENTAAAKPSPDKAEQKFGDSDAGWKNRLTIPSRQPEAEAEKPAPTAFHDLRSVKPVEDEAAAEPAFAVNLPSDITSDEMAAISAAAASLTGEEVPEEPEAEPVAEFQTQPAAAPEGFAPEWEVTASQHDSEPHHDQIHHEQIHHDQTHHHQVHHHEALVSESLANENRNAVMAAVAEMQPAADSHASGNASAASEAAPEEAFTTFASMPAGEADAPGSSEFAVAVAEPGHQSHEERPPTGILEDAGAVSPAATEPQAAATQSEAAAEARPSDFEIDAALESLTPVESAAAVGVVTPVLSAAAEPAEAGAPTSSLVENLYSFKWIAQEVPLDEGVSALILEQEMQKVYAAIGPPDAQAVAAAAEIEISADSAEQSDLPAAVHSGLQAEGTPSGELHSDLQPGEPAFIAAGSENITARDPGEESNSRQSPEEDASALAALGFVAHSESEVPEAVEAVGEHAESVGAPEAAIVEVAPELREEPSRAEASELAPATELAAAETLQAAQEPEPSAEAVASEIVTAETGLSADAVSVEAVAESHEPTQHQPAREEQPVAFAAAASASATASAASVTELAPAPVQATHPSARWDDDDQAPDVAAAWARWRQIRDTLATPEFTEQLADAAAAELAAAESHAAPDFKDIRQTDPHQPHAESAPKGAAAASASADSAAITSIVESVLAELKPRLVEEIAKKLANK